MARQLHRDRPPPPVREVSVARARPQRAESDLRGPLRAGASDADLADRWQRAVAVKLPGHGINDPSFLQPDRPMSAIGG